MVGMHLADDLGVWENYGQLQRDFQELYYNGIIRKRWVRRNSRAIPGTSMKKEIPHSSSNFFRGSPINKANWPPPSGWGPDTFWNGGVFRSRSGWKITSSLLEDWGIPNIIQTKMRDNAE